MDQLFSPQTLMFVFGIIAAILVLGILVAVHETGHLLMAKMCGIRVDVFSVGMGKAIWSHQFGETIYQIGWIPFGGYCAFGEDNDETRKDPRSIMNAPFWAKFLAIIGGSLFNIIFALFTLIVIYQVGYTERQIVNVVHVSPTVIQQEKEVPSPAWEAGVRSGDTITAISDSPIRYFNDITMALLLNQKETPTVSYVRDGQETTVPFTPIEVDNGMSLLGVAPVRSPEIADIQPDSPAAEAGLRVGDTLISIDGTPIRYAHQAEEAIMLAEQSKKNQDEEIPIQIRRGEETLDYTLTLRGSPLGIEYGAPELISVMVKGSTIGHTLMLAGHELNVQINQMFISIQKLFTGKVNVQKNLSGPVRIVSITGTIAQTLDFILLIRFAVMLSIALAVFNMMPLPGLDGGILVLSAVRAVFGYTPWAAPVEKVVGWIEQAGMVFLIAIAAFVFINDIRNISQERRAKAAIEQQNNNP
ncbi:MAG: RIP metalloprotease RseP [Brevinema sp.]